MSGPPEFMRFIENIQTTYNMIEDLPVPTIAAVNGLAFGGGCELALACDFRIMAEDATLGVPEIKIGALPGGTARLAQMLPPAVAKQMIYFGDPIPSDAALRLGLVNMVVPTARVVDTGANGRIAWSRSRRWRSEAARCWCMRPRTPISRPRWRRRGRRWRSCTAPRTGAKEWPRFSTNEPLRFTVAERGFGSRLSSAGECL